MQHIDLEEDGDEVDHDGKGLVGERKLSRSGSGS